MSHQQFEANENLQRLKQAEEVRESAKDRPITPDEAALLRWVDGIKEKA